MEDTLQPDVDLARKVLPAPLLEALEHVFRSGLRDCMLVGGTALSGFYAGHRRSDDLDLYARDPGSFRATTLAVRQLARRGAEMRQVQSTASYSRTICTMDRYAFSIDVVLDPVVFEEGRWHVTGNGIVVASLATLLMCKAATLVSRAGEKDLFDLIWLFDAFPDVDLDELMRLGRRIDTGLVAESVLLSLASTEPRQEACDFGIGPDATPRRIHSRIRSFRKQLIAELRDTRRVETPPGLAEIVRRIKGMSK